jgi:DNA-directed RNA polymerase subunit RPC12/RpoP
MTSLRQIRCPECDSHAVKTERLPETRDEVESSKGRLAQHVRSMNVKAKITCEKCGHVWEGKVSNPDRRSPWLLER